MHASSRQLLSITFGMLAIVTLPLAIWVSIQRLSAPPPLLLAPMMNLTDPCILPRASSSQEPHALVAPGCDGTQGSAARLVESTLARSFKPDQPLKPSYELGYTLQIPLLRLFDKKADEWVINQGAVQRYVRTLRDTDRPAILYLFSTHFGVHAPIEQTLAQSPANLASTPEGPLPADSYYTLPIFPWSVARIDNGITHRRTQAVEAILQELCLLQPAHREKIRGITLLGEVHHLFPKFETGMGFATPYLVSDYSQVSQEGFRHFLAKRFGDIGKMNEALGADYADFAEVFPPSRDIRTQPLRRWQEHMDSYAHGSLPVSGWARILGGHNPAWIHIYRNGEHLGRVRANLGRQDVVAALPEFGSADVGWRFDMDFTSLPPGVHRIDVALEEAPDRLVHLGTRHISIRDKDPARTTSLPMKPLPAFAAIRPTTRAHIDTPVDQSTYYFNPLAPLWHEFRGRQVQHYLEHFARVVKRSCLAKVPTYAHQIMPMTNPSWDAEKFAIDASLQASALLKPGVSLYGGATYGMTLFDWLARTRQQYYGITEFHPLRPMAAQDLHHALMDHRQRGAQFLSFFLESDWPGRPSHAVENMFSIDERNPQFGSDQLHGALRELATQNYGMPLLRLVNP